MCVVSDERKDESMKVFGTVAEMKAARASLGNPGTLAEAITATGIDALFLLLDGGVIEIEGQAFALVEV